MSPPARIEPSIRRALVDTRTIYDTVFVDGTVNRGNDFLARPRKNTDNINKPLAATKHATRGCRLGAGGQAWSKGRRVIDCLAKVVSDAVFGNSGPFAHFLLL